MRSCASHRPSLRVLPFRNDNRDGHQLTSLDHLHTRATLTPLRPIRRSAGVRFDVRVKLVSHVAIRQRSLPRLYGRKQSSVDVSAWPSPNLARGSDFLVLGRIAIGSPMKGTKTCWPWRRAHRGGWYTARPPTQPVPRLPGSSGGAPEELSAREPFVSSLFRRTC